MSVRLRIVADLEAITAEAGEIVASAAAGAVSRTGAFHMALCGGRTPEGLYRALAGPLSPRIPWEKTTLCLGDERRVPEGQPESNAGLVRRLLLAPLEKKPAFLAPDGASPEGDRAASAYETALRASLGEVPLTLSLQGLGDDGHTASIFPSSPALTESDRWVLAVPAPTTVPPPIPRITLTAALLTRARFVLLLISGASKKEALARMLAPQGDELSCPARLIHRCQGEVTVLCDRASFGSASPEG
ncbi:MAG: 6-phosphogluconolactonase [Myxococcales bacterium]